MGEPVGGTKEWTLRGGTKEWIASRAAEAVLMGSSDSIGNCITRSLGNAKYHAEIGQAPAVRPPCFALVTLRLFVSDMPETFRARLHPDGLEGEGALKPPSVHAPGSR
jgi:hypothetical protein